MRKIHSERMLPVPEGVTISIKSRIVTVTGPRGELKKSFKHLQSDIRLTDGGKTVRVEIWFGGKKDLACLRTVTTHIQNMFTGVLKGYEYKMRFVYAHFPVNAIISDDSRQIQIKNFLGEKITRQIDLLPGVTITRSENVKDEIVLVGNSIENVSQSAALIQQSCLVKNKDIRKFLDGIYVSESRVIGEE